VDFIGREGLRINESVLYPLLKVCFLIAVVDVPVGATRVNFETALYIYMCNYHFKGTSTTASHADAMIGSSSPSPIKTNTNRYGLRVTVSSPLDYLTSR
jgi:hypothetical protein